MVREQNEMSPLTNAPDSLTSELLKLTALSIIKLDTEHGRNLELFGINPRLSTCSEIFKELLASYLVLTTNKPSIMRTGVFLNSL